MTSLIHADIFFFITSIAVTVGGILIVILLIYAIFILRDVFIVSERVKRETELIAMDIDSAREHIKKQGEEFSSILGFFKGILNIRNRHKKSKSG